MPVVTSSGSERGGPAVPRPPETDLGDARTSEVDPNLLRRAIEKHAAYIYRFAMSIVSDRSLADDVVQETMIKAWRFAPIGPDGEVPRAWLTRVAKNTAIGILRRRREELYGADGLPEPATELTPVRAVEGREALGRLKGALSALAEDDRALIMLREIDGLSYEEIAEALQLPLPTVKTRLFRARSQLKQALEGWR